MADDDKKKDKKKEEPRDLSLPKMAAVGIFAGILALGTPFLAPVFFLGVGLLLFKLGKAIYNHFKKPKDLNDKALEGAKEANKKDPLPDEEKCKEIGKAKNFDEYQKNICKQIDEFSKTEAGKKLFANEKFKAFVKDTTGKTCEEFLDAVKNNNLVQEKAVDRTEEFKDIIEDNQAIDRTEEFKDILQENDLYDEEEKELPNEKEIDDKLEDALEQEESEKELNNELKDSGLEQDNNSNSSSESARDALKKQEKVAEETFKTADTASSINNSSDNKSDEKKEEKKEDAPEKNESEEPQEENDAPEKEENADSKDDEVKENDEPSNEAQEPEVGGDGKLSGVVNAAKAATKVVKEAVKATAKVAKETAKTASKSKTQTTKSNNSSNNDKKDEKDKDKKEKNLLTTDNLEKAFKAFVIAMFLFGAPFTIGIFAAGLGAFMLYKGYKSLTKNKDPEKTNTPQDITRTAFNGAKQEIDGNLPNKFSDYLNLAKNKGNQPATKEEFMKNLSEKINELKKSKEGQELLKDPGFNKVFKGAFGVELKDVFQKANDLEKNIDDVDKKLENNKEVIDRTEEFKDILEDNQAIDRTEEFKDILQENGLYDEEELELPTDEKELDDKLEDALEKEESEKELNNDEVISSINNDEPSNDLIKEQNSLDSNKKLMDIPDKEFPESNPVATQEEIENEKALDLQKEHTLGEPDIDKSDLEMFSQSMGTK